MSDASSLASLVSAPGSSSSMRCFVGDALFKLDAGTLGKARDLKEGMLVQSAYGADVLVS